MTTTSGVDVLTWHYDNYRTGANPVEKLLTRSTVSPTWFGRLADIQVDGTVYTQPLVLTNAVTVGKATKNAVYFATSHNSVYAVDEKTGTQFWKTHLPTGSVSGKVVTTIPATDIITGVDFMVFPEIGITGTPVIDAAKGLMYLCYATKEVLNGGAPTYHLYLVALDVHTGAVVRTKEITGAVPGKGEGGNGTTVVMGQLHANQRGALLLLNGVIYVPVAGHANVAPYHGWLFAYRATDFLQLKAFCTTPDGTTMNTDRAGGGIWMGGNGPSTDGTSIFFSTGNGHFNANTVGGKDYGNSVLRMDPTTLTVLDYFTPFNQKYMDDADQDLGSAGVMLVPDHTGAHPRELIVGSKPGQGYVIDRDAMGGYSAVSDTCLQSFVMDPDPTHGNVNRCFVTPCFFNGKVYYGMRDDYLKAYTLTNGLLAANPIKSVDVINQKRGCSLSVSGNGTTQGIVWSIDFIWDVTSPTGKRQTLIAYNSDTLAKLYSSVESGDELADYSKFSVPTVANGKVFVGNGSHFSIFGLREVNHFRKPKPNPGKP